MNNSIKNHKMLAQFASIAYKDSIHYEKNGWRNADQKKESGFFGVSFINDKSVVIVFRGTDDNADWLFSNPCFLFGCTPHQYSISYEFAKYIADKYPTEEKVIIGHSLGGALAQLTGIALNLPAISFDSPGTLGIAERMFNKQQLKNSNITAYVSTPNGVNIVGKHITELIQIVKTPTLEEKKAFSFFSTYTIHFHNIEKIIESFDDNANLRLKIQHKQENWSGLEDIYTQFYQNKEEFQECYYKMNADMKHFKTPPPSLTLDVNKGTQITIKVTKYFAFQSQESECFKNHKKFNSMFKISQGTERDGFNHIKDEKGEYNDFTPPVGTQLKIEFNSGLKLLSTDSSLDTYTISTVYTFPARTHCSRELFRDTCDAKVFLCQFAFKEVLNKDYNCEDIYGISLQPCSGSIVCDSAHGEL